jgi:hypothetical protein
MSTEPLLIVQHQSPLRTVSDTESLAILTVDQQSQPRQVFTVDTRPFQHDVEGGHWRSSHGYLRQVAGEIRNAADQIGAAKLLYLGVAEVAHVIALGAYVGDERLVEARDYDRYHNTWAWPEAMATLNVQTSPLPHELISQPGIAVLRVELSYPILDADIDAAIGVDRLADIRIGPAEGAPAPGLVRAAEDVMRVRQAVRGALAALATSRPNIDAIHLFIAAPVSVCFAVGQELRLRNGKDVQTYRYRSGSGDRALTRAILLTHGEMSDLARPLSAAETALAADLRSAWQTALDQVREHARLTRSRAGTLPVRWYTGLTPAAILSEKKPFRGLRPIWELVGEQDRVSMQPFAGEFEFDKESREWRISDELALGLFAAADKDRATLLQFVRLFFWHEYAHEGQGITSYTAAQIGRLANCLEHIDYSADAYAIFHQIDFLATQNSVLPDDGRSYRQLIFDQVGVALRSFWAFENPPPITELQERRLRRYLNWYWRRVQLRESPSVIHSVDLLARQPCIEISGLRRRIAADRSFVVLAEPGGFRPLHIGTVLENDRLDRRASSVDASIEEMVRAFAAHDRDAIQRFFNAHFDHLKQVGGVLPDD